MDATIILGKIMKINNKTAINIITTIALIIIAVSWRIINHSLSLMPNLEIVTAASVLAALIIGMRGAILVPLATMIISDLIIGNSSIFLFTWGAFAVIGLASTILRRLNKNGTVQILGSFGFAIFSSFFFFFATNLGVWLQGWYPMTASGLVTCFTLAVPFYRTMLIGNIIIVPVATATWQIVHSHLLNRQSTVSTTI